MSDFKVGDRVHVDAFGTVVGVYPEYTVVEWGNGHSNSFSDPSALLTVVRPTTQEQFAALPLGAVFRAGASLNKRIKISEDRYYSTFTNAIYGVWAIATGSNLTIWQDDDAGV